MKILMLEGPEAGGKRPVQMTDRQYSRDAFGTEHVKETHRQTQPRPYLDGWRHYLIVHGVHRRPSVMRPQDARRAAEQMRAVFYASGTWEDATLTVSPGQFPCPRREILAQLTTQQELPV